MKDKCALCHHRCSVDRSLETGFCGIDARIHISHYGLHTGEEPFLTGRKGSGTIFFAGCSLRCRFCQNFQISRWRVQAGYSGVETVTVERLAEIFRELESMGAANINLVSPTPYAVHIAEAIGHARTGGFSLPFVYNTHGYDSEEALGMLDGLIDIYLPDMKYSDDDPGMNLSGATDMYAAAKNCLREMYRQTGPLKLDRKGLAKRGMAVRHLVIPGHIENSLGVLDFLETLDRGMHISLMSQFHPCSGNPDEKYPELNRPLMAGEYERVVNYAQALGFRNLLLQEPESHVSYLPDFDREDVFTD
jgi:putative pyruvate formate lyase activating enzyme